MTGPFKQETGMARTALVATALGMLAAGCSFHASFQAGSSNAGQHVRRPRAATHNHADHEVTCAQSDPQARSRCEDEKRRAQAQCDAIDRETRERTERAEREAAQKERETEEQAERERKEAEAEAARRQQEADANAQAQLEEQHRRRDAARVALRNALVKKGSKTKSVEANTNAAPSQHPPEANPSGGAAASGDGTSAATNEADEDAAITANAERVKAQLREDLEQKNKEIAEAAEQKKAKIRRALDKNKADLVIAAQRKRNEVHMSLKNAAQESASGQ